MYRYRAQKVRGPIPKGPWSMPRTFGPFCSSGKSENTLYTTSRLEPPRGATGCEAVRDSFKRPSDHASRVQDLLRIRVLRCLRACQNQTPSAARRLLGRERGVRRRKRSPGGRGNSSIRWPILCPRDRRGEYQFYNIYCGQFLSSSC